MSQPKLICKNLELINKSGELIHGDLHFIEDGQIKPIVVVCHSFMAFKDWGFFPYVCEKFAEAGFVSLIFNFSFNGVPPGSKKISDLKKFEQNTISKELEDLDAVLNFLYENRFEEIDLNKVILLGHSRGAGIAAIKASTDHRVNTLISWSSIAYFDRWTEHQKEKWRKEKFLPLSRDVNNSPLRLVLELLNDVEKNRDRLNLIKTASRINVPWLILHGMADIIVPYKEAEDLYQPSNKKITKLILMEKVGHTYNASSPNEDNYKTMNEILNLTINWLYKQLQ